MGGVAPSQSRGSLAVRIECPEYVRRRDHSETEDPLERRLEQLSTPTKVQIERGVKVEMKGFSPPRADRAHDHTSSVSFLGHMVQRSHTHSLCFDVGLRG
jgi:hypothetical protein